MNPVGPEGRLERRNGEKPAIKRWRALPDPKVDAFADTRDLDIGPIFIVGGRMERWGRALDEQAQLQWDENKVGLALALAFVVAVLLVIGW